MLLCPTICRLDGAFANLSGEGVLTSLSRDEADDGDSIHFGPAAFVSSGSRPCLLDLLREGGLELVFNPVRVDVLRGGKGELVRSDIAFSVVEAIDLGKFL